MLSEAEVKELFAFLKGFECSLPASLVPLLNRLEKALFLELTIAEIEELSSRHQGRGGA